MDRTDGLVFDSVVSTGNLFESGRYGKRGRGMDCCH